MMMRRKPRWGRLVSGLYVPPFLEVGLRSPGCCCQCSICTSAQTPEQLSVVISGIIAYNEPDNCAEGCVNLNDTFILQRTSKCQWQYIFLSTKYDIASIREDIFSGPTLGVLLIGTSPFLTIRYTDNSPNTDCKGWSSETIAWSQGGIACDATGSSSATTAL